MKSVISRKLLDEKIVHLLVAGFLGKAEISLVEKQHSATTMIRTINWWLVKVGLVRVENRRCCYDLC